MNSLLTLALLFLFGNLTGALALWLGAKWAKIPGVSYGRALMATLVIWVIALADHLGMRWLESLSVLDELPALIVEFGLSLFLTWMLIKLVFRSTWRQAIVSWLPTLVSSMAGVAVVWFFVKPYVFEAFAMDGHSMAPTLLGPHKKGVCPHCGQTATVSANPRFVPPEGQTGMCESCLQAGLTEKIAPTAHPADRFLVNKTRTPQRWDLVVFRYPKDPSVRYVKRLVGLPGEEVVIKDGGIWINGEKQDPPAEIAKLTFVSGMDSTGTDNATPDKPVLLGQDKYFVLGDFAMNSSDSRYWGPVPGENLEGVVDALYWPPSRWRRFR